MNSKSILIAIALFMGHPASHGTQVKIAKNKVNVCSVAINSTEEIDTFKSVLGNDGFNYYELTDLGSGREDSTLEQANEEYDPSKDLDWFQLACQRKIRCDILIVSGHFGGAFFGDSGLNWSIDEMERQSCDTSCDGILQAPKEVFLFGCNTLAGKTQDRRTPQEYRRVLMDDGFSAEQAESVVAFRYSPLGESFYERMQRIFRGTPRIYGFDSVAPSGKNVKPYLTRYLKVMKQQKYYSSANIQNLNQGFNIELAKALKVTALAQTTGAKQFKREQIPICYLQNPKVGFISKLNWIEKSLNSKNGLSSLPAINDFLNQLSLENYPWKDKEFEIIERVTYNRELRAKLEGFVKVSDEAMLSMQLKVLGFMKFFGWIFPRDYMKRVEALVLGDLNRPFTIEKKDQICSHAHSNGLKIEIDPDHVPQDRWSDPLFIETLGCLASYSDKLLTKAISEYLLHPSNSPIGMSWRSIIQQFQYSPQSSEKFFSLIFPNGEMLPDQHRKDLLCNIDYADSPQDAGKLTRYSPENLKPDFLHNPSYLEYFGCYLKLTEQSLTELLDFAAANPKMSGKIAEGLLIHKDNFELDVNLQDRLIEFILKYSDPTKHWAWDGMLKLGSKILNLNLKNRLLMIDRVSQVFTDNAKSMHQILLSYIPEQASYPVCRHLLSSAERRPAQLKSALALLSLLTAFAERCVEFDSQGGPPKFVSHSPGSHYATSYESGREAVDLQQAYYSQAFRLLQILSQHEPSHPSHDNMLSQMSEINSLQVMSLFMLKKDFRIRELSQLKGLDLLNLAGLNIPELRSEFDEAIFALTELDLLQKHFGNSLDQPGALNNPGSLAMRVLRYRNLELPALEDKINSLVSNFKPEVSELLFEIYHRQSPVGAAQAWLKLLQKLPPSKLHQLPTPPLMVAADSVLLNQIDEALKNGRLSPQLAGTAFELIAQDLNNGFVEYENRWLRLQSQFGSSPKLQAAYAKGLRAIQKARERCESDDSFCEDPS